MKVAASRERAPPDAAPSIAPRLICLQARDPEFLDRAIAQMRAAGPDAAIVGEALAAWWRGQKAARTGQRDAAVAELAASYAGKARPRATMAARDLARYAANGWKRDHLLDASPLEYAGTRKALFFRIMRENGGKPLGFDRIRQIAATHCNQTKKLANF
jgi:hypothetical protein